MGLVGFVTLHNDRDVRRAGLFCGGSIDLPAAIAALGATLRVVIEVVE